MKNKVSVLFVDDSITIRKLITELLKEEVEELITASNGKEGLKLFKKFQPDIVITDISMPTMDGLQMSEEIKKINHKQLIIIFSGFTNTEYLQKAISIGISGYILKPLDVKLFLQEMEKFKEIVILKKQFTLNKIKEKELLEYKINESRLKTAQSLADIGNWELDLFTNELYWCDEIFNLFEIDKSKFTASYEAFLNSIHPEDRELVNNAYLNSLKTKENYAIQHRLLMSDGRIKYVEEKCKNYFDKEGKPLKSVGTVQDISNLKLTELELNKTLSFLKSYNVALDESNMVTKSDLQGNIIYANDRFCKVSGYTKEEIIGKPHSLVRHPSSSAKIFKKLWRTIKAKKVWKGILLNKGKFNDYWVDIVILPILDDNEEIIEYIAVRHDITKMVEQQQKLDDAVNIDTLTGFGSRYKLNSDILSSDNPSLAILNIDNFSQVNDFYGHEKGDNVIKQLGKLLNTLIETKTLKVYHLQGDEYALLGDNKLDDDFIDSITEISLSFPTTPIVIENDELFLSVRTAISFEDKNRIFQTADMALKVAKKENKNIVVYKDKISLDDEYQNNIKWAKKVKEAIENDNIVPVFQPIVNNTNGSWEKYECLVRLRDEDKLISPYFFLDISKKAKHYIQITKIMMKKSFDVFKDKDFEFSINITIEDILNNEINEFIVELLENYKIGSRVVFEIVESESIENFEQIQKFIQNIKSYGCKIAIDDFGTGYSNFEYLLKLKADYIKIDGSMIKYIDIDKDTELVVSTIIDFAKKLGMKTVAEFVENESVLNKVKELGIDYSQGYYFREPQIKVES